jgi:RNA polymerase sigma factor (TIGR02999 family)
MARPAPENPDDLSTLFEAARSGDAEATDALFAFVYDELRVLARRQRRRVGGYQTVNTTALVHEAYLKLLPGDDDSVGWENRLHFFRVAARAMRQILIDYARRRQAQKRGGDVEKVSLDQHAFLREMIALNGNRADMLVALDEALNELEQLEARQSRVVECRFFGGLTIAETAEALDVSTATVNRDWAIARTWLFTRVKDILGF